jgi:putative oxidoreductase
MNTLRNTAPLTSPTGAKARLLALWDLQDRIMNAFQPLAALLARLYVAQVFFASGLTKLRDWETTVLLFTHEYQVPVLSPAVAAAMGTAGELALPVLLVLGLGGRIAPIGLSIINVVAVISLSEIASEALQLHITWGVLLAGLSVYGVGNWSADCWVRRWLSRH